MSALHHVKTYTMDQVVAALESTGIPYQVQDRQVNADLNGDGHHHLKITPTKGLFLDASTGKGGTIAQLLRQIGAQQPQATTPHPAAGGQVTQVTKPNPDKAQKIWDSGWTCTHAKDMPTGWDKGLPVGKKAAARARLEHQRDVIRDYLISRLGTDHLDHWNQQVRISPDGLMLCPMQKSGVIVGVQRVFFDDLGKKNDRKYVQGSDTSGVGILPVPHGVMRSLIIRDVSRIMFVGEGWETVAATVQAAGHSGLCAYSAGGLVKWAQDQADRAKSLTPEQISKAPVPIILADRDLSGAGQKAAAKAVKVLRAAGLRAYYAIPPAPEHGGPNGGPKGSDWGDYPREGGANEIMLAHLKLAIASGDADMPQVDDESTNHYTHLMPVRRAQKPRALNLTMENEQSRAIITKALARFVQQAQQWQQWQQDQKGSEPAIPTLGMEITTGLGKSTAIKKIINELQARGIPTVIVAQDKNACESFEKAGAFWRHGREDSENGFLDDWHCPKMDLGQEISSKEHFWGPTICSSGHCEHGNKRALFLAEEKGIEPSATVLHFFRERPELLDTASDHCWLDHLSTARDRFVIVVTAQGFGLADMETVDGQKRLIIIDESVEWTHSHKLGLANLRGYIDGIDRLVPSLEQESQGQGEDAEDAMTLLKNLLLIKPLLQQAAKALGIHCTTKQNWIDAPTELVALAKQIGDISSIHTQAWERPTWNRWTDLVDAPLRATAEIIQGAKSGSLSIRDGELLAVYPHPTIAQALGQHPFLLADATLDLVAKSTILANDGEILRIVADQHLDWICDPTRFRGAPQRDHRGHIDEKQISLEVHEMKVVLEQLKRPEKNIAIIAQKPKAIRLLAVVTGMDTSALKELNKKKLWHLAIQHGIGWWNWHHKAHDDWAGYDLIIWDQPAIPRSVIGEKWEEFRALRIANGENPTNILHFTEDLADWIQNVWMNTGDQNQQSRSGLHKDPEIRAFMQDMMDAARLQAAGRVRGVNHADCRIYQLGGTPVAALPNHGIKVTYQRLTAQKTDAERKAQEHDASLHQLTQAAGRVIAKGQSITRESLQAECRAYGTDGVCPTVDKDSYDGGTNPQSPKTAPRSDTYQEWFQQFAPLLADHMQVNGRQAKTIKELKTAQLKFGADMLKEALKIAEHIFTSVGCNSDEATERAWMVIENDPNAKDSDLVAARLVLIALGETEGVPRPGRG